MRPLPCRRALVPLLAVVLITPIAACSSGTERSASPGGTTVAGSAPTSTVERPAGPAADVSQELTGGAGVFVAAAAKGVDLSAVGWEEHEYVAAGTATSYTGATPFPGDGRMALQPRDEADYRTRIVVRRPAEASDFKGTVVVEWLNVSGGLDAGPDWSFAADELVRSGMAWVGVSAQHIGVEGGAIAVAVPGAGDLTGKGLKKLDPARYGSLQHPGDAYAYDIYTQVARALRAPGSGGALGDLRVERILAAGESQSGFALTTYVNGVQPLTRAFDGFLIHSRGGASLPLGEPGTGVSIASSIGGEPVTIRTDNDVPVLTLQTETDLFSVIGYYPARQDDSDRFRLWEVAGTAHADATTLGPVAGAVDCGVAINDGPQRFAVRAAVRSLDSWMRTGTPPPVAPRFEVDSSGEKPAIARDADGNALGGIRLPQIEVPVARLSGEPGPTGGLICLLLGQTVPFNAAQLSDRYPSRQAYLDAYTKATDAAIGAGFAVAEDRAALLADAKPDQVSGG